MRASWRSAVDPCIAIVLAGSLGSPDLLDGRDTDLSQCISKVCGT